jgi:hypothetical protein
MPNPGTHEHLLYNAMLALADVVGELAEGLAAAADSGDMGRERVLMACSEVQSGLRDVRQILGVEDG